MEGDSLPLPDDLDPPEEGAATRELATGAGTTDSTDEDSAGEDAGISSPPSLLTRAEADGAAEIVGETVVDVAAPPDGDGAAAASPAPPSCIGGPGKMN